MAKLTERLRGAPEQGLYLVLGGAAIVALFAVGFIIKNDRSVRIDFVLFSTSASLIWVILLSLILGAIGGIALMTLVGRSRTTHTTTTNLRGSATTSHDRPHGSTGPEP